MFDLNPVKESVLIDHMKAVGGVAAFLMTSHMQHYVHLSKAREILLEALLTLGIEGEVTRAEIQDAVQLYDELDGRVAAQEVKMLQFKERYGALPVFDKDE
jgi:hypothetical protein